MFYLHPGVHKTATTYLQDLLALNQGRIAEGGRAYWRREQIRSDIEHGLQEMAAIEQRGMRSRIFSRKPRSGRPPMARLREKLDLPMDCILSEENMIGHASESLQGRFYPRAAERLRRIREALDIGECEIWLCVRDYPTFLTSLYTEALRHGYYAPVDDFVRECRDPAGQWPALVDAIRSVFPESRFVMWRYEDFRAIEPVIIRRLTGLERSELAPLPVQDVRTSPSGRAVNEHAKVAEGLTRPGRVLSMIMQEQKYPQRDFPKRFFPWAPSAARSMQAAYRADVETLRATPGIEWLSP